MAEKKPRVIKGSHSTRTEYPDDSVEFVSNWDELLADVKTAIADYESGQSKKNQTKKSSTKKVSYTETELKVMDKKALENVGRELGVELDRRKKKDDLIQQLLSALSL